MRTGHDVGRLINMLSHQLKRQMCIQEEEDSLTTNHAEACPALYFVPVSAERYLSERCGERIPDPQVYCYGDAQDIGEERIYHERAG